MTHSKDQSTNLALINASRYSTSKTVHYLNSHPPLFAPDAYNRNPKTFKNSRRPRSVMGHYTEEEDVWKCRKHPRKHRTITTGVCPLCLRDRLIRLCPECANVRPCACIPTPLPSSSSSSSFSSFNTVHNSSNSSIGAIGRISNLIEKEPAFQRSRSTAAFPFLLRSKSGNRNKQSFWSSMFKAPKLKKVVEEEEVEEEKKIKMMIRSRSVGNGMSSDSDQGRKSSDVRLKARNWHFPSPIKAFRGSSKASLQQSSPLCRG